ncbi:hypothetical protein [Bailinhaonella thermotolerans]|uniref:Uncharacterized protein n=1 Tax=Bailinhaonella thermotolerans TaxID=1070861 RepID=A0A3A4B2X6_9ACTN|nr:hypothetical protein [Bailinhaonella thermotolerans]RJL34548.1 hypothetical protein D5H75_09080 [Bailinhaonella thermotolerans]
MATLIDALTTDFETRWGFRVAGLSGGWFTDTECDGEAAPGSSVEADRDGLTFHVRSAPGAPVHVRIERWDAEPGPEHGDGWKPLWRGRMSLPTGRLGAGDDDLTDGGEALGTWLAFEPLDGPWNVEALGKRLTAVADEPGFPVQILAVSLYKVRIWP